MERFVIAILTVESAAIHRAEVKKEQEFTREKEK
jgi:hypothetical protein